MRALHVRGEQFTELESLPERLPAEGLVRVGSVRHEFGLRAGGARLAFWPMLAAAIALGTSFRRKRTPGRAGR